MRRILQIWYLLAFLSLVPFQNNTWDCGVFVCRYAYAVYQLRRRNFTYKDAGLRVDKQSKKKGAFYQLITEGSEFQFDMRDIARFREEYKILIERLSEIFLQWRKSQETKTTERTATAASLTAN